MKITKDMLKDNAFLPKLPNTIDCCYKCLKREKCSRVCSVVIDNLVCTILRCNPDPCSDFEPIPKNNKPEEKVRNSLCNIPVEVVDGSEYKPDDFDVFINRVKSLAECWENHRNSNRHVDGVSKMCIEGFLSQANDGYSKLLIENTIKLCGMNHKGFVDKN